MKFKKLTETATIPTRGTPQSAGLDLYSDEMKRIPSGDFQLVPTNVAVELPEGTVGKVCPRSGLAVKHGIDVLDGIGILAGTIDADYRKGIGVVLINHGEDLLRIEPGDRIAQLVVQPVDMSEPEEVYELDSTQRTGGWGSTGV